MRLLRPLIAALFVGAAGIASAQSAAPSFDGKRLESHIKTLSSDAFEGRGPATPGEKKAIDYIVGQLRAAGLEPAGDFDQGRRQWTQAVPLLKADIVGPPQVSISLAAGRPISLAQGEEIAVRAPMNGASAVKLDAAPLLFVGYGVSAPERGWDDFKGVDVKGKILVVLVNDPDFEGTLPDGAGGDFGGKAMTYYGRWTYKYEEAARRGAAGVMVVHETGPASYGWATVKNSNTNTMFDIVRAEPAKSHVPFESWIQLGLAEQLFRDSGLNFAEAKAAARRKDFKPIALKSSLSASLTAKSEQIRTYNIAARVRGRTHPDENIVYSAHYDHLGIGEPDANGDRIFNGAVDNSTGVSLMIEMARAFAKGPKPQRSVLFLAVGAEEKGLLGSEYYASNPLYPLSKTVAVLNTDSMGIAGAARDFSMAGLTKLELVDLLVAEGAGQGRTFTPDAYPQSGGFYRSDHFSFAKRGVPAISFKSGRNLLEGGIAAGEKWGAEYQANRYHQPDDEWNPDWRYTVLYRVGSTLANSRQWPNWSADAEFRAARDATASERR